LAFRAAIAEKLRSDPKLLEKVRDRLRVMLSDDRVSISTRDAYREWLDAIERHSFEEVLTASLRHNYGRRTCIYRGSISRMTCRIGLNKILEK
jgi:hypothetical protein